MGRLHNQQSIVGFFNKKNKGGGKKKRKGRSGAGRPTGSTVRAETSYLQAATSPASSSATTNSMNHPSADKSNPALITGSTNNHPSANATSTSASKNKTKKTTKVVVPRTNWSKGAARDKLQNAINEWDERDTNPAIGQMSMRRYAKSKAIPFQTFQSYGHGNSAKRQTLGDGGGKKSLLPKGDINMIVEMIIRRDRANEGYTRQEIVNVIMELDTSLLPRQGLHPQNK